MTWIHSELPAQATSAKPDCSPPFQTLQALNGAARETVCEVNRQRAMIGGGLEQTNEFGVEA
jgi:hypothetical protein